MRIAPPAVNHRSVAASLSYCEFVVSTSAMDRMEYLLPNDPAPLYLLQDFWALYKYCIIIIIITS